MCRVGFQSKKERHNVKHKVQDRHFLFAHFNKMYLMRIYLALCRSNNYILSEAYAYENIALLHLFLILFSSICPSVYLFIYASLNHTQTFFRWHRHNNNQPFARTVVAVFLVV